jgi:hypothetical protein
MRDSGQSLIFVFRHIFQKETLFFNGISYILIYGTKGVDGRR